MSLKSITSSKFSKFAVLGLASVLTACAPDKAEMNDQEFAQALSDASNMVAAHPYKLSVCKNSEIDMIEQYFIGLNPAEIGLQHLFHAAQQDPDRILGLIDIFDRQNIHECGESVQNYDWIINYTSNGMKDRLYASLSSPAA